MVCWKYPIKLLFAADDKGFFSLYNLVWFFILMSFFYNNYRGKIIPADLEAKILEAKQKVCVIWYIWNFSEYFF